MANAEEVAERSLDARLGLAVPPHAENEIAEGVRVLAEQGHPDVGDAARPLDFQQRAALAGRDPEEVFVASGAIVARGAVALCVTQADEAAEWAADGPVVLDH